MKEMDYDNDGKLSFTEFRDIIRVSSFHRILCNYCNINILQEREEVNVLAHKLAHFIKNIQ